MFGNINQETNNLERHDKIVYSNPKITDAFEIELNKEEKTNSSFSLNFLQEQNKQTEKRSDRQQDQVLEAFDTKDNSNNVIKPDSNLNIDGSMLSLSSMNSETAKSKSSNAFTKENLPEWVKLEAHVIVTTNSVKNKRGYIKFIGETEFRKGLWIGVELEENVGLNDGSVEDIRYFTCPINKGVFVRHDKLFPVNNRDF